MTREEFDRAFTEVISMEYADIPMQESEIDVTFSQDFIRKMDNLIALQQEGVWRFLNVVRRHIAVIVIIILGVSISACGINQVITHFYGNVYEEMREEFYSGITAKEITYEYKIVELPKGYEITGVSKSSRYKLTEYENERGGKIFFLQDATSELKMHIQNEKIMKSNQMIRGLDIVIFENSDLVGAMWLEDGYFMEIIFYGCEDSEEVIELIESIE